MADSPTDAEAVAALLSMGTSMAGGHIDPSTRGAGARRVVHRGVAGAPGKVTEPVSQGEQRPSVPLLRGHPGAAAMAGNTLAAALPAAPAQCRPNLQDSGAGDLGPLQWGAQRRLRGSKLPDLKAAEAPAGPSVKCRKVSFNALATVQCSRSFPHIFSSLHVFSTVHNLGLAIAECTVGKALDFCIKFVWCRRLADVPLLRPHRCLAARLLRAAAHPAPRSSRGAPPCTPCPAPRAAEPAPTPAHPPAAAVPTLLSLLAHRRR